MSKPPDPTLVEHLIASRESLAHFSYPYLDQALDHPLVSRVPSFRGRAFGHMAALRLLGLTSGPESRQQYWEEHVGDGALVTQSGEKTVRDTFMAARDAFRITRGAHLALRKAKAPREERADLMRNSPSLLRLAGYTSRMQNALLVPLPRPVAQLTPGVRKRPYMTPYSVPANAFELNRSGDALVLSEPFYSHIREFRYLMRDQGLERVTGCPALTMKVDYDEDLSSSLLALYWQDYINAVYEGNPHQQRVPRILELHSGKD